jgi:flavin-dependent dehydrogenase
VPLPTGAGVSREAFDSALVRAAIDSGAQFLPNTTAALIPIGRGADRRKLRLRTAGHEHLVEARIVLAAGGLGSKLDESVEEHDGQSARNWEPNSRVGAGVMLASPGPGYQPGTIYMACGEEGYVGQAIVEDGRVDMAAALDPVAVKRAGGAGELAAAILDRTGFPSHAGLASLPWKGTPHLTRQAPRLGGERLFVLGDAAGYIEPFTGEGMAWALTGAVLVAPLALQACRTGWQPVFLARWTATYRRAVTRRQPVCRLTAGMLRRQLTTNLMVRTLGAMPWVARPFLHFMYRD